MRKRDSLSQFSAAFRFVQHHGRRADLDRNRGIDWWVDAALSRNIGGPPISGLAFVFAVIAAGDVLFTDPTEAGFYTSLQFGGGGSPATDYWRRVVGGAVLNAAPAVSDADAGAISNSAATMMESKHDGAGPP